MLEVTAPDLDSERCYEALRLRDARFDGRFFVGVRTTGIFCRPVCPAPRPRASNCSFWPSAAAAQAAGFRPCLRCRPESAPGTPAWQGTAATVSRALRLIEAGGLDEGGSVDRLASQLGVGSRHLRRLFQRHLGATPRAVARMRRVLFAKQLVDETDWSMTEIALSAGFGSQRRFNACMREVYGRAPSELRRQGRRGGDRGAVELSLVYRPPFDWASLLEFLRPRAIPGVESVEGGEYARTFRTVAGSGSVRVRHEAERNRLRVAVVASGSEGLIEICARLRQLFDLDAEVAEVDACLSRVPLLQPSVRERPGMRVPGAFDAFETTVRAILGQQISVAGATTLAGRIASRWGDAVPPSRTLEGTLRRLFPTPACLAEAPLEEVGIIGSRARTIRALARAVAKDARFLQPGPGLEADLARWRQLPGVGPWTAQIVSMRVLREPDALPADDLGLRKAVRAPGAHPCSARQVEAMLESCRPFRAYAAVRLWSDPPLQSG